jgi:hypothetical protein
MSRPLYCKSTFLFSYRAVTHKKGHRYQSHQEIIKIASEAYRTMYEDWSLELCATNHDLVKNAFGSQSLDFIRRNLSYCRSGFTTLPPGLPPSSLLWFDVGGIKALVRSG